MGIVDDPAFFDQPIRNRHNMLAKYAWVEFRTTEISNSLLDKLAYTGFVYVDTQIHFRISLQKPFSKTNLESLTIRLAREYPFKLSVGKVPCFEYERFHYLPGITEDKHTQRYAQWANSLIKQSPQWCLEMLNEGKVQGWFLAQMTKKKKLNLVLAMLHKDAHISGFLLYEKALTVYASLGARIGWASFSVYNSKVMNIYSYLGARFLRPSTCWLWLGDMNNKRSRL